MKDMENDLTYYGGQGYDHSREGGTFEVKANDKRMLFDQLQEAREYYNSLNTPKALWDTTNIPELLECHY